MGWSIGYDDNWKRDIGYGVPAKCDHPDCDEDINRGLGHVCGGEDGCGLFFCEPHGAGSYCERCGWPEDGNERQEPFTPKPDTQEWIDWKMTDPSWKEWREENGHPHPNTQAER